jgi:hypothetical protein
MNFILLMTLLFLAGCGNTPKPEYHDDYALIEFAANLEEEYLLLYPNNQTPKK